MQPVGGVSAEACIDRLAVRIQTGAIRQPDWLTLIFQLFIHIYTKIHGIWANIRQGRKLLIAWSICLCTSKFSSSWLAVWTIAPYTIVTYIAMEVLKASKRLSWRLYSTHWNIRKFWESKFKFPIDSCKTRRAIYNSAHFANHLANINRNKFRD